MEDWKFDDLLSVFSDHSLWADKFNKGTSVATKRRGQLWFAYPHTFGDAEDNKEGHIPYINQSPSEYCKRMALFMGLSETEAESRAERFFKYDTKTISDGIFFMAQLSGVSCWTARSSESSRMWSDFVSTKNGVAIRSNCLRAEHALLYTYTPSTANARPMLCAVEYVDHSKHFLPYDGFRNLLSIVSESYSCEREVRFTAKSAFLASISISTTIPFPFNLNETESTIIINEAKLAANEQRNMTVDQVRQEYNRVLSSDSRGFFLPVCLKTLLQEVVLKSTCTSRYEDKIRKKLSKLNLGDVPVRRSLLH